MIQIRKLTEVCRALTYAATLGEVFQMTVDRAADLLATDRSLLLVTGDDGLLALRSSYGIDPGLAERFRHRLDEALAARLAGALEVPVERFVSVPLVVAGEIIGVLVVILRPGATPAEDDEWVLSALADQAALALEKTRLDEIAAFRERLIGIVGHDLRNPLSAIVMSSQLLLQRETLGEKDTAIARRITSSANRAMRLIEQLLDLTRSRLGGGIPIDPTAIDLARVVARVTGELDLTHPESPIHTELRGDLAGVWDRDRLYQLLINLVGNAVTHGAPRSPVDLLVDGDDADVVRIEVANRGTQIPPDTLLHIFEPFRQGPRGSPSKSHGLGLGLFIAQEIARAHGGAVAGTSSDGGETRFVVQLPRGRGTKVDVEGGEEAVT